MPNRFRLALLASIAGVVMLTGAPLAKTRSEAPTLTEGTAPCCALGDP